MKWNKSLLLAFGLLVVIGSVYRVWDGRPWGFAPQIAMAIFAGSVIASRRWAFVLPLLSMFLSDLLYHALYLNGYSAIPGFYEGQLINYILFGVLTVVGFFINRKRPVHILVGSLVAPTIYFLLSNFTVWIGGGGWVRSKTFSGLMASYVDGLPFYQGSLLATVVFSAVLFGGYHLAQKKVLKAEMA